MFYFYGRKKQLSGRYPEPQFGHIVEPFAGAAAYSLRGQRWRNEVTLIERDPRVAEVWEWLIAEATPRSIASMPSLEVGQHSTEFLHIVHAATKQAFKYKQIKVTPVLERNWEISKRVMAASVEKVRHWTITCADYTDAPDIEATWFIDPPYKGPAGLGYEFGSDQLDYGALATWIRSRRGQIIACEGSEGDYLPFSPLVTHMGVAGKRNAERVWLRSSSDEDLEEVGQLSLL